MSYQDDKRELLKLKQGLIEESKLIREEKPQYEKPKGFKRIVNFFYHYKWHVVVVVFFAVVIGFMVYDLVKKEDGDIRVLLVTKDKQISNEITYKVKDIELALEKYCPDFDDSGYVHVEVYNIDLCPNGQSEYELSQVSKVMSELMLGEAQMFIVDSAAFESITSGNESTFVELSELYPDCEQVDGIYYKIKGSGLATMAKYEEACPEDLYIVLPSKINASSDTEKAKLAQESCRDVMDNIVNNELAGWIDDDGRVYGIYNE